MPNLINIDCYNHDLQFFNQIIPFNQYADIIPNLDKRKHKDLLKINKKFGGLCELICNNILRDNLLGEMSGENLIKKRVTVESLNENRIKKSHLLSIYSIFRKIIAFLFGVYPDNIFSRLNQWKLVKRNKTVNRKMLERGIKKIEPSEVLKLEVFSKGFFTMSGHSLLIKKMANNKFIFFDPNTGEHRNLSFVQLSDHIDEQLRQQKGNDIFLTKGQDFLKRVKKKIKM